MGEGGQIQSLYCQHSFKKLSLVIFQNFFFFMEKFKHAQSRKDRIANPHVPTSQLLGGLYQDSKGI